jgi:hypothetical protein
VPRLLALLMLFLPGELAAGQLEVGDRLPALVLEDQFGREHRLDEQARLILFLPDRRAARIARKALRGQDQAALVAKGIVGIGDISGMPLLITYALALPKLRDQPWLVLLGMVAEVTALFPRQAEAVTLIRLQAGVISAVEYFTNKDRLREALGFPPEA